MRTKLIYLSVAMACLGCFTAGYFISQENERKVAVSNLIVVQADQLSRDAMILNLFKQNCPDRLKWMLELQVRSGVKHLDSIKEEISEMGLSLDEFNKKSRFAQATLQLADKTETVSDASRECKQVLNSLLDTDSQASRSARR